MSEEWIDLKRKMSKRIKQTFSYYLGNWDVTIDLAFGRQRQIAVHLTLHGKVASLQRSSRER